MSFDDIEGAPVIRASQSEFNDLEEFINSELDEDNEVEKIRVADIALSVGLKEKKTTELSSDNRVTFNMDSLDKYGVLKTIIEERHQDAEPAELRSLIQKYLEGGFQHISTHIDEKDVFNYHDYLELDSTPDEE
jgi:hypothetical protein